MQEASAVQGIGVLGFEGGSGFEVKFLRRRDSQRHHEKPLGYPRHHG